MSRVYRRPITYLVIDCKRCPKIHHVWIHVDIVGVQEHQNIATAATCPTISGMSMPKVGCCLDKSQNNTLSFHALQIYVRNSSCRGNTTGSRHFVDTLFRDPSPIAIVSSHFIVSQLSDESNILSLQAPKAQEVGRSLLSS